MTHLEELTLSIGIRNRSSFLDGIHFNDHILSSMPKLRTFTFDIDMEIIGINAEYLPSSNDIRRTFIEKGHGADCYIDHRSRQRSRCHVYSFPFPLNTLHTISNNFPGGLFVSVRRLCLFDATRPFENDFFVRLSQSFPLLKILSITNNFEQEKKQSCQSVERKEASSMIRFAHLTNLYFDCVHIDYLEEFFLNSNMYLPCLTKLCIEYEDLLTITENFTNNAARSLCSKVEKIDFHEETMVLPKEFYLYFPLM